MFDHEYTNKLSLKLMVLWLILKKISYFKIVYSKLPQQENWPDKRYTRIRVFTDDQHMDTNLCRIETKKFQTEFSSCANETKQLQLHVQTIGSATAAVCTVYSENPWRGRGSVDRTGAGRTTKGLMFSVPSPWLARSPERFNNRAADKTPGGLHNGHRETEFPSAF